MRIFDPTLTKITEDEPKCPYCGDYLEWIAIYNKRYSDTIEKIIFACYCDETDDDDDKHSPFPTA